MSQKKQTSDLDMAQVLNVARNIVVKICSWLRKLLVKALSMLRQMLINALEQDEDYQSPVSKNMKQNVEASSGLSSAAAVESGAIKSLQDRISHLENVVSCLQNDLRVTKANCIELKKRLDSITGETIQDMENLKKEVYREMDKRIPRQEVVERQPKPEAPTPHKLYFESSADGMSLINATQDADISSNFIELDPKTGFFTIVQSKKCIEYIFANRDYALASCEVNIASANPISIRVEKPGIAVSNSDSADWTVTQKMIITLY